MSESKDVLQDLVEKGSVQAHRCFLQLLDSLSIEEERSYCLLSYPFRVRFGLLRGIFNQGRLAGSGFAFDP